MRRFSILTASILAATALLSQQALAATVVVPNANATTGGDAQGPAPFNYYSTTGSRNQVLYPASQFSAVTGTEDLTTIQFRPYPGSSTSSFVSGTVNISDVIITLSTTTKTEQGATALSTTYASNIGPDATTVYSGPLTLTTSDTDTNGGATKAFDYTINLQTPFAYTPSQGNLLLDVNIPTGATVSGGGFGFVTFDNVNDVGDGIASIVNLSSGSATTGTAGTDGAIAQFTFASVPEPASSVGPLLMGATTLLRRSRRRTA